MEQNRYLRNKIASAAPRFVPEIYRRCGTACDSEVLGLVADALFNPIFNGNNSARVMVHDLIYDMEKKLGGFQPYDS